LSNSEEKRFSAERILILVFAIVFMLVGIGFIVTGIISDKYQVLPVPGIIIGILSFIPFIFSAGLFFSFFREKSL